MSEIKQKRNIGIDYLRIIAMFFIVAIHTLRHGGILDNVIKNTSQYRLAYLILTIVNSGVIIFALISGFVGYSETKKKHGCKSFFILWLTVVFYDVLISTVFYACGKANIDTVIKAFFPISNDDYWYFTAYFFVFLLSPYINDIVRNNSKTTIFKYLIAWTLLLYFSHAIEGFFSKCLLLYLYFIGSILKKYDVPQKIEMRINILIIVVLIGVSWIWIIAWSTTQITFLPGLIIRYDSPVLIITGILWLLLFAKVNWNKAVNKIAPSIFSVYLVNDNPLIRELIIKKIMSQELSSIYILLYIISQEILFWSITLFVDFLRIKIFSLIHIADVIEFLNIYFNKIVRRLIKE